MHSHGSGAAHLPDPADGDGNRNGSWRSRTGDGDRDGSGNGAPSRRAATPRIRNPPAAARARRHLVDAWAAAPDGSDREVPARCRPPRCRPTLTDGMR